MILYFTMVGAGGMHRKPMIRIECAFGKLKDWRRAVLRYDRYLRIFFSACAFAAVATWWI